MNRQQKVRRITYAIIVVLAGILLMVLPGLPMIRYILSGILVVLGLIQMADKTRKQGIVLVVLGAALFFLYPFVAGSLYLLGLILVLVGIAMGVHAYLQKPV